MMKSKYVIELSRSLNETVSTSSKGNQSKYLYKGKWYKLDCMGYEGLAEVLCSRLAKAINFPYETVEYRPCVAVTYYGDKTGCESDSFLKNDTAEYSLPRLMKHIYNTDIDNLFRKSQSAAERIQILCEKISSLNGLSEFGRYLTAILEFDRLVLNEDRHFHNILVIQNMSSGIFGYAPLFDNGAALFSDTVMDYPLSEKAVACRKKIKSKPFSTDFDKQVNAAQSLFGAQINPPENIFIETEDLYQYYDEKCITRCINTIRVQMQHYYPEVTVKFPESE